MCDGRRGEICPYIVGGCSKGGLGWPPGKKFTGWSGFPNGGVGVGVSGIGVRGSVVCGTRVCGIAEWGVVGESGRIVRGWGKVDDLPLWGWFGPVRVDEGTLDACFSFSLGDCSFVPPRSFPFSLLLDDNLAGKDLFTDGDFIDFETESDADT